MDQAELKALTKGMIHSFIHSEFYIQNSSDTELEKL